MNFEGSNTLPRPRDKASVRIVGGHSTRPSSLYDNLHFEDGGGGGINGEPGGVIIRGAKLRDSPPRGGTTGRVTSTVHHQAPSMTASMVTTVPQNIAAPKIEGRHAPTRTSLRHSRMIVLTKQGKVPRKYLPRVVKRHKLATSLLILKLLMGITISTLSGWLYLWAPNLSLRDIPFWSGFSILFSAVIGMILLCSCRKEYPGMPVKYHVFAFKIVSMLASLIASTAGGLASAFASLHLVRLYGMICEPPHVLNSSCVCRSKTQLLAYQDLNCLEVWNVLTVLLIASAAANGMAAVMSFWYLALHWSSSSPYSRVKTNDNRPIIVNASKL